MGYISEGVRTIDNQSDQDATLHMITTRVILPQLTMIGQRPLVVYSSMNGFSYRMIIKKCRASQPQY